MKQQKEWEQIYQLLDEQNQPHRFYNATNHKTTTSPTRAKWWAYVLGHDVRVERYSAQGNQWATMARLRKHDKKD